MGIFPPTAGLTGGPRFGVLGLVLGAGTATKNGSFGAGGKASINANPPAKTVLGFAAFSSRLELAATVSVSSLAEAELQSNASSAARVTRGRVAASQFKANLSSAAVAVKTS